MRHSWLRHEARTKKETKESQEEGAMEAGWGRGVTMLIFSYYNL
jgi:hypothetical protein